MANKNKDGQSYGAGRTRNYACVVYPDSAPENWKEIIAESKVPVFISPLHDQASTSMSRKWVSRPKR